MLRRTSPKTIQLSDVLVKEGLDAAPRRLERWSSEGLGPVGELPFGDQLGHYRAVARLAGSGVSADLVALRLAGQG